MMDLALFFFFFKKKNGPVGQVNTLVPRRGLAVPSCGALSAGDNCRALGHACSHLRLPSTKTLPVGLSDRAVTDTLLLSLSLHFSLSLSQPLMPGPTDGQDAGRCNAADYYVGCHPRLHFIFFKMCVPHPARFASSSRRRTTG